MPSCSKLSVTINHQYYFVPINTMESQAPGVKLLNHNVNKVCFLFPQGLSTLPGTEWNPNKY